MRSLPLTLALFACSAPLFAQHLVCYDPAPGGTGTMTEVQLPSIMVFGPVPPAPIYPIALPLPPFGVALVPPGDATYNGLTNQIWYCNGNILASMPSPSFPLAGPAIPPFVIAPAVLAAIGGAVTGIALNPIANVMFLCGPAGLILGVTPVPGTPVVVPPFGLAFPTGPLTGLDYDSITGTLLAVDAPGMVYQFALGGFPVAPPVGPMILPGIAGDVAIDKTAMPNAAGVRGIYVIAGPLAIDVTFAAALPMPTATAFPTGLAFLPRPAKNQPTSCNCGAFIPRWSVRAPMASGQGGFGLLLGNAPPFTPTLMAFDNIYNPALPVINFSGCGLGLFLGSPTIQTFFAFTDGLGNAGWGLPLNFLPPGIGPVYAQAFWTCAADPTGFALTEVQQIVVTGH
jgi:hypothetical protein